MNRKFKVALIVVVLLAVAGVSFAAGCKYITVSRAPATGTALFNEAWDAVHQDYVESSKLDSATLSHGAIQGMMQALNDPYSAFLDPEQYKLFQSQLTGSFSGIGAQVQLNADKQTEIIAPLENSPAMKAGLKTGDIILAVDGKTTQGMTLTEVVFAIRGPVGTPVTLTIQRQGETATQDITIVRAQISNTTVSLTMNGDIAVIRISEFAETTNDELNKVLQSLDMQTTKGIILDLRDNPGGIVTTVVDVASHFIKKGVIITLVDNKGNRTSQSVRPNGLFTDLPVVVLVNQYSASGAEVLTGALKDHERATVAGVKTFGKGSYDINIPLSDGSDIYLTVGRWATPNGDLIEGKGITPDHVLTQTGNDEVQWAVDYLHGKTP